ncbi:MAG: single-stranded DNA-binding protein [Candidatus Atribacteria bacterium]|nr:single-stranded DNA-binding protein [Candidatus Atribacteria bacterium]
MPHLSLNRVFLIGFLPHSPVVRYVPSGIPVVNFSLAVYRTLPADEEKEWIDYLNIIAWRDLALFCGENLKRGDWIFVEGRVQVRTYDSPEGKKKKVYEIVASGVKLLSYPENKGREEVTENGGG